MTDKLTPELDLDALQNKAREYARVTAAADAIPEGLHATEEQGDEFWRVMHEFYTCLGGVDGVLTLIERVKVAEVKAADALRQQEQQTAPPEGATAAEPAANKEE